jgi:hypothetical protein
MIKKRVLRKAHKLLNMPETAGLGDVAAKILSLRKENKNTWKKGEMLQFVADFIDSSKPQKTLNIRQGSPSKDFYKSTAWQTLRYLALKLNSGRCECCGARASDGVRLHVDHIKPRSAYPELALSIDNLQVLCEDCNVGKSDWDVTDWRTTPEVNVKMAH